MVQIYTTPTCAYCKLVEKYLNRKGIPFETREASEATEYPSLAQKFGFTVPLIINGDKGMVGFDIVKLNALV